MSCLVDTITFEGWECAYCEVEGDDFGGLEEHLIENHPEKYPLS